MATALTRGLPLDELRRAIRAADPRAVLVPPRILRRIIRREFDLGRFGGSTPHRQVFVTTVAAALRSADRAELDLAADRAEADDLILLPEPADDLNAADRETILRRYWEAIYHGSILLTLATDRDVTDGIIERGILRIGPDSLAEARSVLVEDRLLVLPADDRRTFVAFAAVVLQLAAFHPGRVGHVFPSLRDPSEIVGFLSEAIDTPALLDASRPDGAPAVAIASDEPSEDETFEPASPTGDGPPSPAEPGRWSRWLAAAETTSARGNRVRAALLKAGAARIAPESRRSRTLAEARVELDALVGRLQTAFSLDPGEASRWRAALPALLDRGSRGVWPREARFLYDVQRLCSDREREVFKVDLARWAATLGRSPLRRPVPAQREVVILKRLRTLDRRLRGLRLDESTRGDLRTLIRAAIDRQARSIRDTFRGLIVRELDSAGIRPSNAPERAARRKAIEELLDLVVDSGYLRIGDLRDAISRNPLKLDDLSGPREFLSGDGLLRADRGLAGALEGVYHRGEVYLRMLQRVSSVAFGTRTGRAVSLILALPVVVAFITLEGLQHLVGPAVHALGGIEPELLNLSTFLALAGLVFGLVNVPRFRAGFARLLGRVGRAIRGVFYDIPAWFLRRSLIRAIVRSGVVRVAWDWLAKPALGVAALSLLLPVLVEVKGVDPSLVRVTDFNPVAFEVVAFVAIAFGINSRRGRDIEEIAADGVSRLGQRIWTEAIPNLFRGIVDLFGRLMELVERLIYGVDQWLRFRGGEGRATLAAKAVTGLVWFLVAYVVRIYITLLIEPQINPIKHFPVVTVSHKLMLPLLKTLFDILKGWLSPLGDGLASAIAGPTLFLLPGFFGFLAWELKENWRLYGANRSPTIRPLGFGHHGETMSRLLRPGFHSGTVPRLYARLRKADRRVDRGRTGDGVQHRLDAIHHVGETTRHFVERCLIFILEESRSLGAIRPVVREVRTATNRIEVEVGLEGSGGSTPARIAFVETERRLVATIAEPGWLAGLGTEGRSVLRSALAGLFALCAVDRAAGPRAVGLVDLKDAPITWTEWVETWDGDALGQGHAIVLAAALVPIPDVEPTEASPSR